MKIMKKKPKNSAFSSSLQTRYPRTLHQLSDPKAWNNPVRNDGRGGVPHCFLCALPPVWAVQRLLNCGTRPERARSECTV